MVFTRRKQNRISNACPYQPFKVEERSVMLRILLALLSEVASRSLSTFVSRSNRTTGALPPAEDRKQLETSLAPPAEPSQQKLSSGVEHMGLNKEIKHHLKETLDEKRYRHTLNVRHTAIRLANAHLKFDDPVHRNIYLEKVSLAALIHDIDKQKDPKLLMEQLEKEGGLILEDIRDSRMVWHAFTAAIAARDQFGITDPDILNAVRYHTTGRQGMTDLEKIIYLADYIEPGRRFSGVEEIRKASEQGLDEGTLAALDHSIDHLAARGIKISPLTLRARKDIMDHGIFRQKKERANSI